MDVELNREEFINQYPPVNLMSPRLCDSVLQRSPAHMYVHLPFCRHRCSYCYYKLFERHDRKFTTEYISHLKLEMDINARRPNVMNKIFRSLYIGGGTPTVVDADLLVELIDYAKQKFQFTPDAEICIEAKPDERDLSEEKLRSLKDVGVNRVSFGVETLNEDLLRANGREASTPGFFKMFERARKVGFDIINLDFMSGIYGETDENWQNLTSELLRLRPDAVAFYKMEVYLNTKMFKELRRGASLGELMTNAKEIAMINYAFDRLEREGKYLPVNCFNLVASPEKEHVHRRGIWSGEPMLGMGLSSHSDFDGHLYQNASTVRDYYEPLLSGSLPIRRAYKLTARDEMSRFLVYGLKNLTVERSRFLDRFGIDMMMPYGDEIRGLVEKGYVTLDDGALKVPREFVVFADDICRAFFLPEYKKMMVAHLPRA